MNYDHDGFYSLSEVDHPRCSPNLNPSKPVIGAQWPAQGLNIHFTKHLSTRTETAAPEYLTPALLDLLWSQGIQVSMPKGNQRGSNLQ